MEATVAVRKRSQSPVLPWARLAYDADLSRDDAIESVAPA
jgi:hypothetical protein